MLSESHVIVRPFHTNANFPQPMASSVDNPPRTSLEGPQSGPIPLFDFHLRILADSYISFFQERCARSCSVDFWRATEFFPSESASKKYSAHIPLCRAVIADSRRRASIESLSRLHQKSKAIDTYLDDHVEINSTRRAWSEVRDNVERGVHHIQSCITFLKIIFSRNTSTRSFLKYSLGGCPEPVDQYESE